MEAKISSIRLIKGANGWYWLITLVDDKGNIIGTFGDEKYCSDIDFRNQTFGIMKILNNWDLLNLDGKHKYYPVMVDGEYGRINVIANSSGHYLKIDYNTGEILHGMGCDISNFNQQYIANLFSRSGCLSVDIISNLPGGVYSQRGFSADLSYKGFQPIYSKIATEEQEKIGASSFRIFVCGILDLCNIDELIQTNNFPTVSIKFDANNNIVALGSQNEQEYLFIPDNGYEFSSESKKR